MINRKTSDYLVIKVCHNSLSQYGQVNPLFPFFNNLLDGTKNSIPQHLHLYFLGFSTKTFLPDYIILNIYILQKFFPFLEVN